jgi:hypothetical protein
MRVRRPLAALAAVCLAAIAILALTAHAGRTATSSTLVPLTITPSCAAVGERATVHLTASGLVSGDNTVQIGDTGPDHNQRITVDTVNVVNGVLDATVSVPAQMLTGLYRVYVNKFDTYAIGYFSVPCPTLTVQPTCGPADDGSGARYALTVTGTGYGAPPPATGPRSSMPTPFGFTTLPVHIGSEGAEFPGSPAYPNADGTFSVLLTPGRARAGVHTVEAYVTTADASDVQPKVAFRRSYAQFTAPCPNTQTTPTATQTTTQTTTSTSTPTTAPTTAPTTPTTAPATKTTQPQTKTTQTVTTPTSPVTIGVAPTCLEPSANGNARVQVTGGGFSAGSVEVLLDGNVATKGAADKDGKVGAEVELTPGTADHAIEIRQGSRQADATLRVPCTSHPKLKIDPALGPPGLVTKAVGSGFPPDVDVRLAWQPGIGTWTVHTSSEGGFEASVLIFPQDQCGERVLRATPVSKGRFDKVDATFLCVPGSVQQPRTFDFRR